MVKGLFVMDQTSFPKVYQEPVKQEIEKRTDILAPPLSREILFEDLSILEEVEVIFSGWGAPVLDKKLLEAAPELKAFFYAAGSLKSVITEAAWEREILFTSAYAANAVPVSEYTLSQILFSLKNGWGHVRHLKETQEYPQKPFFDIAGAYGSTVGIISLSTIGRKVCQMLKAFDVNVLAYDPFAGEKDEQELGVSLVSLNDIFRTADVVSLHAPLLDATVRMIEKRHFNMMKPHSTFINTARGKIVKQEEMLDVLKERKDLTAVLDVTDPEPPAHGAAIFQMDNIVLTPHLAGSENRECGRMGQFMLEEFKRYLQHEPLQWQVTKETFQTQA